MSKHNYSFRDDAFNPNQAYSYVLVIQAGSESFSYAVVYNNYLVAWEEHCSIDRLNTADDLLDARYKNVIIGLTDKGFTLMPNSAFNPDQVEHVARFLDVKSGEKVYSQGLDSLNQVIYKADERSYEIFKAKYPEGTFLFYGKGFITEVAKSDPSYRSLYLNLNNETLEILNFKNGKLRFYNTFKVKTAEDIVYFATITASELILQPQTTKLILSGEGELVEEYKPVLEGYFGEVITNTARPVTLPEAVAPDKVLSIAALSLCAL